MSGSLFYTVKDEHHILPVNWEKWESTGTRTAQGELAGKQEHFARSDAFTVTRNVNVGLLSIFKEKKSSLHSNSCLSCLCICWGSLSQWQQFDVWLLIPVDAGQGSLHQKDQDAALYSNLHHVSPWETNSCVSLDTGTALGGYTELNEHEYPTTLLDILNRPQNLWGKQQWQHMLKQLSKPQDAYSTHRLFDSR